MDRKKKLRLTQITLLVLGILTIFFTYIKNENNTKNLISEETKKKCL